MLKVITELEKLGLELTDEMKESIKKNIGEEVYSKSELDKKVKKVEEERDQYKERAETAEETLKGFDGKDLETITKERDEWKEKAETAANEYKQKLEERDYKDAVDAAVKDLKFSSNSAKKAFVSDLMSDKLKMKNEVTVTSNATFGMTGMIYFDTPQVNQANPFTCAYMGTENNRQFFAGIMWTKTKNTVTLDYEDVEPGVFLYDILPNDDGTTELE